MQITEDSTIIIPVGKEEYSFLLQKDQRNTQHFLSHYDEGKTPHTIYNIALRSGLKLHDSLNMTGHIRPAHIVFPDTVTYGNKQTIMESYAQNERHCYAGNTLDIYGIQFESDPVQNLSSGQIHSRFRRNSFSSRPMGHKAEPQVTKIGELRDRWENDLRWNNANQAQRTYLLIQNAEMTNYLKTRQPLPEITFGIPAYLNH